jgi:tetratricopeptide (TPR) repeat protein
MRMLAAVLSLLMPAAAQVRQRDLSVERLPPAEELKAPVSVPRGYALVVGIADYQKLEKKDDLLYPESDARAVAQVLMSKEGGNIEPANIRTLTGAQATRAAVKDALERWLPAVAQPEDRVIVFFVGHGFVYQGRGYFAPYDIDPERVAETGYPMEDVGRVLSREVKARWKVLLTDACHSGKIQVDSNQVNQALGNLPRGFLTLTSSRAAESSYEDDRLSGGFGVFSYYLTQGWKGQADVDPADGVVSADELVQYVKEQVRNHARTRGADQNPMEYGDFENSMILGFNPRRRAQAAARAGTLATGTLIVEANLSEVEVYVDEQRAGVAGPEGKLEVPGLKSGTHTVKGVRRGYEPVTREVVLFPGERQTVTLRLIYVRKAKPQAQASYDKAYEAWKRHKNEAELNEAATLARRALDEDPKFAAAAVLASRVAQQQGKTEEALKQAQKAVQLEPAFGEARVQLGTMLMEQGDPAEAVRQLSEAARQDAKDPFVQALLAEGYFWNDDARRAEETATQSIALDARLALPYLIRGDARRLQKKLDEAVADYQRFIDLQTFRTGFLRGVAYWLPGGDFIRYKSRTGMRAMSRTQKWTAYVGLCGCEYDRGNFQRAIGYCEEALNNDKEDDTAYFLTGQAWASLFNRDNRREYLVKARDNLEAALKLNPESDEAPGIKSTLKDIREFLARVR